MYSFLPFSNSDDSDYESDLEFQSYLVGEVGSVEEGALCELTHEHELDVKVCCYLDLMLFVMFSTR